MTSGEIVPVGSDQQIELLTITAGELLNLPESNLPEKASPLYLASDVYVSDYGIRGLVMVDTKPENRAWGYHSNRFYGSGEVMRGDDEAPAGYSGSPEDKFRRYGTKNGFKAIRFFVIPKGVADFFAQDKWLGEPAIEKCCEEGTTPQELWEQPVRPGAMLDTEGYGDDASEIKRAKIGALASILPLIDPSVSLEDFKDRDGKFSYDYFGNNNQRAYLSFHPWFLYQPVTDTLRDSTRQTLANFDEALSRFDMLGAAKAAALEEWSNEKNVLNFKTTKALGSIATDTDS